MNIAIISASPRAGSQSRRVSNYLQRRVAVLVPQSTTAMVDLAELSLPFWTGDFKTHPSDDPHSPWRPVADLLNAAEAVICVVPEHHGMAPPALKNVLLQCRYELAHKPGLLIGVSTTDGGSYPLAELRLNATKNNRINWIPEQVVIRPVKERLLDDNTGSEASDHRLKARIDYALRLLASYGTALRTVRAAQIVDHETFAFGM